MPFRFTIASAFVVVCSMVASAQNSLNPSWIYSSYLGGSQGDSAITETTDSAGNLYVAGITSSTDFPTTPGVYEPNFPGPSGANVIYVSKFNPNGSLLWSTYVGPGCFQSAAPNGIAVDANQSVYISGVYECSGYPTTVNFGTTGSVFITKLNSSGSQLVYSTTLGGNSILGNSALVLDSSNNAYLIGAGDYCCNGSTAIIGPLGGVSDFWVAEVNSAGSALPWSVEIGGTDLDQVYGIAIDSSNKLYLTGYSASRDFPTTSGALVQPGVGRAFIMKLDPAKAPAASIVYSALAGNPGNTRDDLIQGSSIAVDQAGDAYVASWTYNTGLYVSPNAFQRASNTVPNAYVFELNPSGSAITNGTYIGGGADDYARSLAIDNSGNTYVSGSTYSWDFPTTAYGNSAQYNNQLGFYLKLNPEFAAISSVQFGPNGTGAFGTSLDSSGGLWVSGYTVAGLPTTPNAFQPNYAGGTGDGYLIHSNFAPLCSPVTVEICTLTADSRNSERIHFASQGANLEGATSITLSLDGLPAYRMNAAQFDTLLPVAPGTHTAKVTFTAVNQQSQATQLAFAVQPSSSCPLNPIAPSVTICQPLNAAVIKGAVDIAIAANDSNAPSSVRLLIDGRYVATVQNQNGNYTYTATLAPGPHSIYVRGTDINHHTLQTSAVFHVSK